MDIYEKVSEIKKKGQDLVIVTVTDKEGMGPADIGKKMIVTDKGEHFGTIGGGSIELYAINRCKDVIASRQSLSEKYVLSDESVKVEESEVKLNMACGGKATLFYEFVGPKQYVYIFGAGHCGKALSISLHNLGYFVTVIDPRAEVLSEIDKAVDKQILCNFETFINKNNIKENSFVVVGTPSHEHDFAVLDKIISEHINPKYFGMLCSKKKIAEYLSLLEKKYGKSLDLSNLYSPIGLDIGGVSPEEIAVSIASEIQSVYYNKKEVSHMRNNSLELMKYIKK